MAHWKALGLERPDALILGYPVITSGEFTHQESIDNLLGTRAGDGELRAKLSLEDQISDSVPRTFIWHTWEDDLVPVHNTLLLMEALIKKGIPTECHIFEKGGHGLSMADWYTVNKDGWGMEPSCQAWIGLARKWMDYYISRE